MRPSLGPKTKVLGPYLEPDLLGGGRGKGAAEHGWRQAADPPGQLDQFEQVPEAAQLHDNGQSYALPTQPGLSPGCRKRYPWEL